VTCHADDYDLRQEAIGALVLHMVEGTGCERCRKAFVDGQAPLCAFCETGALLMERCRELDCTIFDLLNPRSRPE
jgi:hypothetical protein